ncbi:MAG: hypothetical protein R3D85_02995 [Paracoccaceae bacterium]
MAGPKSRDLLKELIRDAEPETALSNKRFPWLSARDIELGMCPVRAIRAWLTRASWPGAAPPDRDAELPGWDLLMQAGEKHGLKPVGARAQNWLRQEKSHRAFGTELGRDATPAEADLPRFIDLSKDFHGKDAMVAKGIRATCVTLLTDGRRTPIPGARRRSTMARPRVGRLTSGGYSVSSANPSAGLCHAGAEATVGRKPTVRDAGPVRAAEIVEDSPYDPSNANIRVMAEMRTPGWIAKLVLAVLFGLAALFYTANPVAKGAEAYAAKVSAASAATYVSLRKLNAFLSTAQEAEVGGGPWWFRARCSR